MAPVPPDARSHSLHARQGALARDAIDGNSIQLFALPTSISSEFFDWLLTCLIGSALLTEHCAPRREAAEYFHRLARQPTTTIHLLCLNHCPLGCEGNIKMGDFGLAVLSGRNVANPEADSEAAAAYAESPPPPTLLTF